MVSYCLGSAGSSWILDPSQALLGLLTNRKLSLRLKTCLMSQVSPTACSGLVRTLFLKQGVPYLPHLTVHPKQVSPQGAQATP